MRIFLDANILFSAALKGSQIHRLVDRLIRDHEVISSSYAHEEALRNIHLKRNFWLPDFSFLIQQVKIIQSVDGELPVNIAEQDRPILFTALKSNCNLLLTGDFKDFGHLMEKPIGSLIIVSPVQMAGLLQHLLSSSPS